MIKFDLGSWRVFVNGEEIRLTAKEFKILRVFAESPGRLVHRETLAMRVWGYPTPGRTLDQHMATLRKKIAGTTITTIRGVGFRLDSPAEIVE